MTTHSYSPADSLFRFDSSRIISFNGKLPKFSIRSKNISGNPIATSDLENSDLDNLRGYVKSHFSAPLHRRILIELHLISRAPLSFFLSEMPKLRQSIKRTDFFAPSHAASTSLVTVSEKITIESARIRK